MTNPDLAVIILAAGQGTRMKSSRPKILHQLAGIPLVSHVLATADALSANHIVAVVRHERDAVAEIIVEQLPEAIIVDQDEAPGTGRAVELGLAALPSEFAGHVVVLSADVPLLDAATIRGLLSSHELGGNKLTLLSAHFADPTGAGRILRASDG
ncbi:MAG TPA: bifunctional UDP-N-acetylglucosamine diphosphorylase/glucosamine-1-phosphate N-acetyltransferase GlmU, partial [Microbacteriaceae bacterium]|nr:bifunctional UDP-N-acetylglucosamine diphosphorylase/glucosamine-1-phosphate N-acetyltransferase GlmU [Microbacteriaceae bacterium]